MARAKAVESAADVVRRIRERARTEGAEGAYEVALDICGDKTARAADRLDAAGLICRIGGLFVGAGEDDGDEKPLHTLTRAELAAAADKAKAYIDELDAPEIEGEEDPSDPDVFD